MNAERSPLQRKKARQQVILYGIALAVLVFFLKWLELNLLLYRNAFELYIGIIAVIFTGLGVWLARRLMQPGVKTVVIEKLVYPGADESVTPDLNVARNLDISKRELEILALLAKGHSNQEIAGALFISLSTVKSHNQNLFEKLGVKRRMQAVETAKRLNLIR